MSNARRPRTYPPGTPERALADAVDAVYADAYVRLDQLELDITRPASAPHSREEAVAWRAELDRAAREAARAERAAAWEQSMAAFGRGVATLMDGIEDGVAALARSLADAGSQDDYALAGPAETEG